MYLRTRRNIITLKNIGALTICLVLITCVAPTSSAQQTDQVVPTLVNFSGTLTDVNGKPLTGVVGVTFFLYKDEQGGSPLWVETQNVEPDKNGHYRVILGSTTSQGLPTDLFASGEARWLAVQPEGQAEQARIVLLSVPYALKAGDAQTIGGLPASAFILAKGEKASAASASPASSIAPPAKTAPAANPNVTGKGIVDYIPMWDKTSDIVDSILFQKSSQIGVNTTTPAAILDVNGKSDVRDTLTLFPNSTDPTLAIHGTNFKIDRTGEVTFISGQKFPGTGTVTSVGLSAPSSDFTVSGSPVKRAGTLKIAWNVAPTNANTANAIVKRDASGNFSAGVITATIGLLAPDVALSDSLYVNSSTPGVRAVNAIAGASSGQSIGVQGSTYSGASNAYGVWGVAGRTPAPRLESTVVPSPQPALEFSVRTDPRATREAD